MRAELIFRSKDVLTDGAIVEMIIWKVPVAVPPSTHAYKYRLFYGVNGVRVVGYDNERGKGDHCHLDGKEHSYKFTTPERLVADFMDEIGKRRKPR
jgi:hypothetical protein